MASAEKGFREYLAAVTAVSAEDYEPACMVLAAAGSCERAWTAGKSDLCRAGVDDRLAARFIKLRSVVDPGRLAHDCQTHGIDIIGLDDAAYPALLKEIHDPPLGLFVRGRLEPGQVFNVAVVGTRKPTTYGLKWAGILGRELSRAGWTVVSGMAFGIDCAAHEAVLENGGCTVAVLGRGLDKSYPASKRKLFRRLIEVGAVISEFPPGAPALAHHFPQRNRIISGMSRGCVVVEGGLRSGSLITAKLALEEGRDVFAVPGRIGDWASEGPNSLLKEGCAKLVGAAADVLDELGYPGTARGSASPVKPVMNDVERSVMAVIDAAGSSSEEISQAAGLTAAQVQQTLIMLEMKSLVGKSDRSRYYSKIENHLEK